MTGRPHSRGWAPRTAVRARRSSSISEDVRKPRLTIPQVGRDGIPIHDTIDLCQMLDESDSVVTLRPPWSTTA
jgi:hypothetical protein